MERTPKNIDDILRERLYDAAPPPPAFVWDNVERELRKRNRRKLFFWMFSIGIASAGVLGIWLANETGLEQSAMNIESGQTIAQTQAIDKHSSTETTLDAVKRQAVADLTPTEKPKQVNTTLPISSAKGIKTPTPIHQGPTSPTTKKSAPTLDAIPSEPKETTPATLEAKPQKTTFEGGQFLAGTAFARLPQIQGASLLRFKGASLTTANLRPTWPDVLKPQATKAKAKKTVSNCYDFSKQPSAWIIDAYFGPSLSQRELTANPDDKPYLVKRLNTERRDLAFNAGVRASLMLKGNFLVRAGVQYEQMTEVFEFIDPDYVKYHVEIVTQNGMTSIDTVGVDYGERYQKTYNRFGMLDIPLAAGVELRKGRSGFNINAGVSFNMLFWKRGAIISPVTAEPAWFTPKDGTLEVFRPRTGLSATASIQWFYHVTPRLRVFVEPYFKKIMRPITLSSHPVEQRYGLGGLRLGISKILN